MKLVIQRVKQAKVLVDGKVVGAIGPGLFVLLGVGQDDDEGQVDTLVHKLVNLRIMADAKGKMNLSIKDVSGEVLVVSQFTLLADTSYGRRPSFVKAADPDLAKRLYELFLDKLKEEGIKVSTGSFGAYMEIESVTDGPVTIIL
ncbi:D-tyrosyl-tRNA(Tyr) deacylase [Candidatus Saccharibacteria bacterium]|nr:D-tyrosyl-tRNA(Tyr) deacylase [Candidatus Saccharibacteria bacterium]